MTCLIIRYFYIITDSRFIYDKGRIGRVVFQLLANTVNIGFDVYRTVKRSPHISFSISRCTTLPLLLITCEGCALRSA